jgi:hypothetical protein
MELKRTAEAIKFITEGWDVMGIPYTIKHGTYTTILESELGKHKFVLNNYSNRVFVAKNKIKKDVLNSEIALKIMQSDFQKVNYGVNEKHHTYKTDKVLNIDLSSAYVYAIYNAGIITKETFEYLNTLNKKERLPALGMLASQHIKFYFEEGKCVKYESFRQPTANVFFALIQEVNDVMEECRWILGEDYVFHWVDGIFFRYDTNQSKIDKIEKIITDLGFPYKYESVDNFSFQKDAENFVISMVKNGEPKRYDFSHGYDYQSIKRYITQRIKGYVHTI